MYIAMCSLHFSNGFRRLQLIFQLFRKFSISAVSRVMRSEYFGTPTVDFRFFMARAREEAMICTSEIPKYFRIALHLAANG